MTHSVPIRRSLLQNIVFMIVLLGGTIIALTFVGSRTAVRTLSAELINRSVEEVDARLTGFFQPVVDELLLLRMLSEGGLLDIEDSVATNGLLAAVITQHPQCSSMLIADAHGHERMILRMGSTWSSRESHPDRWGDTTYWRLWSDTEPEPREEERTLAYDARTRPWFIGALERRRAAVTRPSPPPLDFVHGTAPYSFFTTGDPGITLSTSIVDPAGRLRVIAADVMLEDITRFTRRLRVSENGLVFVLTDDLRVIGLPGVPRYEDPETRRNALLKHPTELDLTVAIDTARAVGTDAPPGDDPVFFSSGGRNWWGKVQPFRLGADQSFWITVVVPEQDLLGDLTILRYLIIAAMVVVLALAMLRAAVLAGRFSRPIEELVRRSDRISQGDFTARQPVTSRVAEVQRLAGAQERMRVGLQSLMKLEGDLQLAREIQQRTFPDRLPDLPGFDLDAWARPAEETGGDTYDVVGLGPDESSIRRAAFLLADATGHGIGPALSVTQIRAMLRMAVRLEGGLKQIAHHLNEQLVADLPEHRFITAWIGVLDADTRQLTTFSAGQGPLLHYRARSGETLRLPADTPPFGIIESMEIELPPPITLERGDVFLVMSDGVFEATSTDGELFGVERVTELLRRHHSQPAASIIGTLRDAVEAFTGGAAPDDDQTMIVIRSA